MRMGGPLTLTLIGTGPPLLVIATVAGGAEVQPTMILKVTGFGDTAKVGGGVTVMLTGTSIVCAPGAEISRAPI
jgi:hypothetical protein